MSTSVDTPWVSSPGTASSDPQLRASNEGLLLPSLYRHTFSLKGVARLSFTARIGRAQFHRARSASKKDGLVTPYPILPSSLVSPSRNDTHDWFYCGRGTRPFRLFTFSIYRG